MNTTGWLKGLQVTADGTGIVSHAGVALVRALADKTGLTAGLSKALASRRLLIHDRGRVLADLACAIADGAEVISDFRVMGDQEELFGLVASVPTAGGRWTRSPRGQRAAGRITAAVNAARRRAWARDRGPARHPAGHPRRGQDPGAGDVHPAGCLGGDRQLDKELAEPNFKGFGHASAAGLLRQHRRAAGRDAAPGGAGSNTAADHLAVLDAAITALPPASGGG